MPNQILSPAYTQIPGLPPEKIVKNFSDIDALASSLQTSRIETGFFRGRKLIDGNTTQSLQELLTRLMSMCAALPNTQLSSAEKKSCTALYTRLQNMVDVSSKSQGSGLKARIYALWLCIYNWISGDALYLKQLQQDIYTLKSRTEISAPQSEIGIHATNMLLRLIQGNSWGLSKCEDMTFTFEKENDALACAKLLCTQCDMYLPDAETQPNPGHVKFPVGSWWLNKQKSFTMDDALCSRILRCFSSV